MAACHSPRLERISQLLEHAWTVHVGSSNAQAGLETRVSIVVDADHDTLRFRVDADGPERSWQRNVRLVRKVLTDAEYGEIWDFGGS